MVKLNVLELEKAEYTGGKSSLCPGCGHDQISNNIIQAAWENGIQPEKIAKMSGIGCSSKTPAYFLGKSHGFNTVHGRMPSVTTGANMVNKDLSFLAVSGDGDTASIGIGQFIHAIRRNLDMVYIVENNGVYGLTKGQYSPTSEVGMKTKSTPMGSVDHPINPIQFAIGAEASFIARTVDTDPKHMIEIFRAAHAHQGTSFIEIFQNCVIYNNHVWEEIYGREARAEQILYLEEGKPLIYGSERNKGIRLNGLKPEVVTLGEGGVSEDDLVVHDSGTDNPLYTTLLSQLVHPDFPTPSGIFHAQERPTYEGAIEEQIQSATEAKGPGDLQSLLKGAGSWVVE